MSRFEYVSVAIALIYSFALARLLGGLPHVARREGRSWIALIWTISWILGSVSTWWIFWRYQSTDWTALRFLCILGTPALIYLEAAILLTDNPAAIKSWSTHYFSVRHRYFGVNLAMGAHTFFVPWVMGTDAWGTLAVAHAVAVPGLVIAATGIATAVPGIHLGLAMVTLAIVFLALLFAPVPA